jgi:hypothetical protein
MGPSKTQPGRFREGPAIEVEFQPAAGNGVTLEPLCDAPEVPPGFSRFQSFWHSTARSTRTVLIGISQFCSSLSVDAVNAAPPERWLSTPHCLAAYGGELQLLDAAQS